MKKLLILVAALLLTGCAAPVTTETPEPPPVTSDKPDAPDTVPEVSETHVFKAEYIKLTPQEAEEMMSGDVLVLDVRTQEEYDEGHIENAVLLPDYEVSEKAESVIPDKNQTILVYCRSGRRSELAARELIELGYTKVNDFGGIADWPGAILCYDTVYYNYYGGELPEDIDEPIDYSVIRRINEKMPEYEFRMEGRTTGEYQLNDDESRYYLARIRNYISRLTISSKDGSFKQEITGLSTENWCTQEEAYGLSFDDWNFDGFLDISLWKYPGGTMMNSPHYFWLWNNDDGEFVANAELEETSGTASVWIPDGSEHVESYARLGSGGYFTGIYKYRDGQFVLTMSEHVEFDWDQYNEQGKRVYHTVIKELINGEMTITEEYDTEYED